MWLIYWPSVLLTKLMIGLNFTTFSNFWRWIDPRSSRGLGQSYIEMDLAHNMLMLSCCVEIDTWSCGLIICWSCGLIICCHVVLNWHLILWFDVSMFRDTALSLTLTIMCWTVCTVLWALSMFNELPFDKKKKTNWHLISKEKESQASISC